MKIRSPIKVFLLSLVTLGIYDLYWLVKTKTALNNETSKRVPTIWLVVVPFIVLAVGLITMLVGTKNLLATNTSTSVSSYSFNSSTPLNNSPTYRSPNTSNMTTGKSSLTGLGVAGLFLTIIAYLLFLSMVPYWFYKFSKSINEYTNGRMSTAVSFLLLWILHIIGVALVQDSINDTLEAGGNPGVQPVGPTNQNPVGSINQLPPRPIQAPLQSAASTVTTGSVEPTMMQLPPQPYPPAPVPPISMQDSVSQQPAQNSNAPTHQSPDMQPNNTITPTNPPTGPQ
jgi:hypothetical protein